ncbi:CBS domain-containing protein [Nocardioides seonyuensis]|nr:CBS domain-containing protein [Nocardioides seonyuensis]
MYTRIARTARPSDTVATQMVWPVATISADSTLTEAAASLAEDEVGALAVIEHERIVGIVSERDVVQHAASERLDRVRVGDVMSLEPVTVTPSTTLRDAALVMLEAGVRHLPVVDEEEEIAGIISIRDLFAVYVKAEQDS